MLTELDDIGDAAVGFRTETPNPTSDPGASRLARHPIPSAQRRMGIESRTRGTLARAETNSSLAMYKMPQSEALVLKAIR